MSIKYKFRHSLRVRFAEVDKHGHVFNAHYLTYFDTAITEYLRHLNILGDPQFDKLFFLVKRVEIDYQASVYFDQLIHVYVVIEKIGKTSVMFNLEIFSDNNKDKLALGKVVWVCVDPKLRQKILIPKWFRQHFIDE